MKNSTFAMCLVLLTFAVFAQADVSVKTDAGHAALASAKARKNGFTPMPIKKSGINANMSFLVDGKPVQGQALKIRISMSSKYDAQIKLTADQGLTLSNPEQVLRSAAGQVAEHSITVVPTAQGLMYVNVFITADNKTSASAIAVQVGDAPVQLKTNSQTKTSANGESMQIMKIE
jgi:hypothetical protein